MSKTYTYDQNGVRPQLVDSENLSDDTTKEVYIFREDGLRPIRTTIEESYGLLNDFKCVYVVDANTNKTKREPTLTSGMVKPLTLTFDTALPGGKTVSLPTLSGQFLQPTEIIIDWGDGEKDTIFLQGNSASPTHTYNEHGIFTTRVYFKSPGIDAPAYLVEILMNDISLNCVAVNNFPSNNRIRFFGALPENHNISFFNPVIPRSTNIRALLRNGPSSDISVFENLDLSNKGVGTPYLVDLGSNNNNFPSEFFAPLTTWDMSGVVIATGMLEGCNLFNEDITGWDMSSMEMPAAMFSGCSSFNQDISGWDMSKVVNADSMFLGATSFNQDLSTWDIGSLEAALDIFRNSGMSSENLQRTIIGWANYVFENSKPLNINLGSIPGFINFTLPPPEILDGEFTDFMSAYDYLISRGWTIDANIYIGFFDSVASFQSDTTLTNSNSPFNALIIIDGFGIDPPTYFRSDRNFRVIDAGTPENLPNILVNSSEDPISIQMEMV